MKSQVKRRREKGMDLKLYEWMTRCGVEKVVYDLASEPEKALMMVPWYSGNVESMCYLPRVMALIKTRESRGQKT